MTAPTEPGMDETVKSASNAAVTLSGAVHSWYGRNLEVLDETPHQLELLTSHTWRLQL